MLIPNRYEAELRIILTAFILCSAFQPAVYMKSFAASQSGEQSNPLALELGKPIEREIKGGEEHTYQVKLSTGQYLHAAVEQKGIMLAAAVYGPSHGQLIDLSGWQRYFGTVPIHWIAAETGDYKIKVRPAEKEAKLGRYGIKLEEIRTAEDRDIDIVSVQPALLEAVSNYGEGSKESKLKAIEKFSDVLSKFKTAGDQYGQGFTLLYMGVVYYFLGENQKALDCYNQALPQQRQANDRFSEISTLTNIGSIYRDSGDKQKALDYYNQALALTRQLGNRIDEANILHNAGSVYDGLGDKQKALDYYNQALAMHRQFGNLSSEANTLTNIGSVYHSIGETSKALDYYNQALLLHRQTGNLVSEANTLNNIGGICFTTGETQKAFDYFNQALPLHRKLGDRVGEARTLNNMGVLYSNLGEKQKALDCYNQALLLRRQLGNRAGEAGTLGNIGKAYNELGETKKALDFLNQALEMNKQLGSRGDAAINLTNIGAVYYSLGDLQKALDYLTQALSMHKEVGNRPVEAITLTNLGKIHGDLGEHQKALDYYNQALALHRQVENRSGEASVLTNIGAVYFELGELQKALDHYNQALPTHRQVGNRNFETMTLIGMAKLESVKGNLAEARSNIESAIKLIEFLRANVAGQQLRSSFFQTQSGYYKLYIDILMKLHKADPKGGFDALALQAGEQSRARGLLELLSEARVDIREGVDPKLLEREKGLRQLIGDKAELLLRLKNRKNTEKQTAQAEKELDGLISEYNEAENQLRASSPKYTALIQPEAVSLKEIQLLLDPDTLLLEYSLGEKRSYLWLVSSTSLSSYELPDRKQIDDKAKEFYNRLTSPLRDGKQTGTNYQKTASELGAMLLGQVKGELAKKRLVIVAEGSLQYIPFAALSLNTLSASDKPEAAAYAPLIMEHEIVSLPSVSTLAVQRRELAGRRAADKLLAMFADPVFEREDPRVKQSLAERKAEPEKIETAALKKEATRGEAKTETPSVIDELEQSKLLRSFEETAIVRDKGFARLLGSRREANAIASLVEKEMLLNALDFDANRTTALSSEMSRYKYVHFATHGLLNSTHPELSGIMLSLVDREGNGQRGFLKLDEIYNMKLNAELAVLSGCETGLGKEVRGEGLVGLTRGFMYAGAKSVMASLWKVQDFTTSELMGEFYRQMMKEGKRPSEALRQAQIAMLKKEQWSNPFFWAGFTFQGDWR